MTPPRFDTLASDIELAQTLGAQTFGALLTLALLSSEQPDLPSGWAVSGSMEDFAAMIGVKDKGTALKIVRDLEAYRLIHRQPGKNLGRGVGPLPGRLWLTYDPTLPYPGNKETTGNESTTKTSSGKNPPPIPRRLIPVDNPLPQVRSSHPTEPISPEVGNDDDYSPALMNESFIHSHNHEAAEKPAPKADTMPLESCPAPLRRALSRLGWNGSVPVCDVEVATALANWVADQPPGWRKSPAGWLRRMLEMPDEATGFVARAGLLARSAYVHEALGDTADTTVVMSKQDYDARCIADPDWEHAITVEAVRRASEQNIRVSMLLKRTIAAQWDRTGELVHDLTNERFGNPF